MSLDLKEKVAVITGGLGGIGQQHQGDTKINV